MKKLTIILLISILAVSCMTPKRINKFKGIHCKDEVTSSKDSTSITTTVKEPKDTTLYVIIESLVRANFECDSHNKVILKSIDTLKQDNNISISVKPVGNNSFNIHCPVDSAAVYLKYFNTHKTTTTNVNQKEKQVVRVEVERKPKAFESFKSVGFWVELGIIVLYLIYRYFKRYITMAKNKVAGFISLLK